MCGNGFRFYEEEIDYMLFKAKESESLLRLIVKAVEKGVGEDIKEYLRSNNKATYNAVPFMRGDNINTNLRDSVVSDTVELKYFKRSAWTGCLLIDRQHKTTYTICTKQTLEMIPKKKDRRIPHYLQSILYVQNSGVEAACYQMSLGDCFPEEVPGFSEEEFRNDYDNIMEEEVSFDDGYTHLVVVYEAEHFSITSIAVKLLDPDFRTAQEYSLEDLLKPDFSELTIPETGDQAQKKDSHNLVSVKSGLKKSAESAPQKETIITPKKKEEGKQA